MNGMKRLACVLIVFGAAVLPRAAAADEITGVIAEGGDVIQYTVDGSGDVYHAFTTPGSVQFFHATEASYFVEYLVVGGGGGSGGDGYCGGGGGGGAVLTGSLYVHKGEYLACEVGAGGAAGQTGGTTTFYHSPDGVSLGATIAVAPSGGGGSGRITNGKNGANGGGSGGQDNKNAQYYGGKSTTWFDEGGFLIIGHNGGDALLPYTQAKFIGTGGGGAGGDGGNALSTQGGAGGLGIKSSITGEELGYGGGGGGSGYGATPGGAGADGGGNGAASKQGEAGLPNRGGGAGGGKTGNAGGNGVVILRYTPVSGAVAMVCTPKVVDYTSITFEFSVALLDNADDRCTITAVFSADGEIYSAPMTVVSELVSGEVKQGVIAGLNPSTKYSFRFVITDEHGNSSTYEEALSTKVLGGVGGDRDFAALDGSGDRVHYFSTPSVTQFFTAADAPLAIEYLVVGGGGGGGGYNAAGSYSAGGGGGGVVRSGSFVLPALKSLAICVGAGGEAGQPGQSSTICFSDDGVTTGDELVTAMYGGAGANWKGAGGAGGNGGGSGGRDNSGSFVGGKSIWLDVDGVTPLGNAGGDSGAHKMAGGGGGGCFYTAKGGTGYGGGGTGANNSQEHGIDALPNRGGGAQGCASGATGGSGVVIFRYFPAGHPAVAAVSELEKGPGFIRANIQVLACGDGDEAVDVYVACGPEGGESGEYTLVKSGVAAGEAVEHLAIGLEAEAGYAYSVKMVGTDTGVVDYSVGTLTTAAAIVSAVPTLADAAVAITDVEKGTVEASAFVAWGGGKSALCQLVLKYGSEAGVYTKERVISAADIGTIRGTCSLRSGTWYAVLVARSSEGESAPSEEFTFYSERNRKGTVFYLK